MLEPAVAVQGEFDQDLYDARAAACVPLSSYFAEPQSCLLIKPIMMLLAY